MVGQEVTGGLCLSGGIFGIRGGFPWFPWHQRGMWHLPTRQHPFLTPVPRPIQDIKCQLNKTLEIKKWKKSICSQFWRPLPPPLMMMQSQEWTGCLHQMAIRHTKNCCRVALSLGIQVEEVKESSHHLVNILALPLSEGIVDPLNGLWQTPASFPPTSKRALFWMFVKQLPGHWCALSPPTYPISQY